MIRENVPDHGLLPGSAKFTSVSATHAHIALAIMSAIMSVNFIYIALH